MEKSLWFLILMCSVCLLSGCAGGSSAPPSPPAAIVVSLSPNSVQALDVNQTIPFTASLSNDSSNQGVTWTVICPTGVSACGAMAQAKSAAGVPDNFVAPVSVGATEIVTVTATSVNDSTKFTSVPVQVNPAFALVKFPPAPPPGIVGQPFSLNLTNFVQGGTPPLTWSVKSGTLPAGLGFDLKTGLVSGTPHTAANVVAVTFTSVDSGNPPTSLPADLQISFTVNPPPALSITSPAPPNGAVAAAYSPHIGYENCVLGRRGYTCTPCNPGVATATLRACTPGYTSYTATGFILHATGGVEPYTWSWAAAPNSSFPPGLNLLNGEIVPGSLGPTSPGSYNVIVTVADSSSPAAQISATYIIVIAPPPPLTITTLVLPSGTIGALYGGNTNGIHLSATGGLYPYTWGWVAAAGFTLPPGLNLYLSGGLISGTPPPTSAGTYKVIVTASDSETPPLRTSAPYTIVIVPPPPPTINTTLSPAIGTLNVAYIGFTFTAFNGLPPFAWTQTGALPAGMSLSSAGLLSGTPVTPSAVGSFPITVQVQDSLGQNSPPQIFTIEVLPKGFMPTGSLQTARDWHTATLLGDGNVLVTGGVNSTAFPTTAELYNLTTGTFAQTTGNLTTMRFSATATLLKSGKVLLAGGKGANSELATGELYDPATQTFAATAGSMSTARAYHTATLLNDGTVLLTGGLDPAGGPTGTPVATAEIYNPATNTFTLTGPMTTGRFFHMATLLGSGKVLITGGLNYGATLATAELYDPATKTFTSVGSMTAARVGHAATVLGSGKVLLTGGGTSFGGNATATAEVYDPNTGSFAATAPMTTPRSAHTATLLNSGQVLVAGGASMFYARGQGYSLSSAELFDPTTGSFTRTADMTALRESHTATLLLNGEVLVVGGSSGTLGYSTTTTVLATAELYQ
jgi:hypothetical protein